MAGRKRERGVGVFREVLPTFWNQFFNSLTVGSQEKVRSLPLDAITRELNGKQ